MHDVVVEMSAKRLGVVGVTDDDGDLVGVITDGDLRRHIEQGLDHPASVFMTANPKTISPDALVDEALTLFEEYGSRHCSWSRAGGSGRSELSTFTTVRRAR